MNCDFVYGINGEYNNFKQRIKNNQANCSFSDFRKATFCKKYGKNKQTDQHNINADKIYAGSNGHTQITVFKNTNEITDINYGCTGAGVAQISAGSPVFLKGHYGQHDINDCNQNR